MISDINPEFSFDLGGSDGRPAQAAWDFSGALNEARQERANDNRTSTDQKIAQRMQSKAQRKMDLIQGRKQQFMTPANGKAAVQPDLDADSSDASSDDEDEDEDEDDEDKPLPGELEDSEGDDESLPELGDDDETSAEEDDDDDEDAAANHIDNASGGIHAADDVAGGLEGRGGRSERGAVSNLNRDGAGSESEEDDEDEEEEREQDDAAQGERRGSHAQAGPAGAPDQAPGQFYGRTPEGTRFSAGSFGDLHLSRALQKACAALGYTHPTPIQAACIPLALAGRDICGSAITGSGKTAAFALPLLERLLFRNRRIAATYALVLTPTRELAVQVHSMISNLAQFTDIRAALVVGGLSMSVQAATLRTSPEIVVATPGRLIDHLRNSQSVGLEDLQALVLDEADRLLQMGFSEEVHEVLRLTPRKRQTLLFSATLTDEVRDLIRLSLVRPVRLAADAAGAAPKRLVQEVVRFKGGGGARNATGREATLLALCSRSFRGGCTIVFFATKHAAHRAKILFGLAGLPQASELHGNMTQAARLESLERFRKGEVAFLLATDVAARGLDILGVDTVINYDAPPNLASYLHRIGRTARAGAAGRSVTFADDTSRALLKEVVKKTGAKLQMRTVQPAIVAQWVARIGALEKDISRIGLEEREERELRRAEMEATKAENMVQHGAEIAARPPKTWFQSTREKAAATERAKAGELGKAAEAAGGPAGGKEALKREKEREKLKRKRGDMEAEDKRRRSNMLLEETEGVAGKVRLAKTREAQLRQEGMTGQRAGRAATASISTAKAPKQQKKTKGSSKAAAPNETGLFEDAGDGRGAPTPGNARVYAGGGRSGKVKGTKGGLSKTEKNKVKRHGKGVHGFKSKARHKRR